MDTSFKLWMVKENISYYIPVILLTAKATVENQVEGLNTGANAYVTKPFEPQYLMALIKSQLLNREQTRTILSSSTQTEKIDESVLSPQDNAFMSTLYKLMESELNSGTEYHPINRSAENKSHEILL